MYPSFSKTQQILPYMNLKFSKYFQFLKWQLGLNLQYQIASKIRAPALTYAK